MRFKAFLLATAGLVCATPAFAAQPTAAAADQPGPAGRDPQGGEPGAETLTNTQEPVAESEAIVVTGSRIRRDGFSANVPVNLISEIELESAVSTNLAEALADLPGVALGDTPFGSTSGENQNSGLATANLRNIGGNRTLTLIDGRRTVSNAANRNVVSTNTIPISFVERVEIITGAASAIYGSDGIAGVVNIITHDDFDGLRLSSRFGTTISDEGGGGEQYEFSGLFGKKFADGRGHLLLAASYENDLGLSARDRERSLRTSSFNFRTNTVTDPSLTNLLPGGWFNTTTAATSYFYDENNTLRRGFVQNRDGFDIAPFLNLRVPRTSTSFAAKATFEVSEAFRPFATVMYNELGTQFERAPGGISSTTAVYPRDPETGIIAPGTPAFTTGRIPRTNPFAPPEIRAGATATGIPYFRRFMELGPIRFTEDRQTIRAWAGVNGKILNDWFYEASYGYGRFRQDQLRENGLNLLNVRNALNVQADPAGGFRCVDAAARAAGCVPLNLFGAGSITPAAADFIRANTTLEAELRQDVFQAYATGNLLTLPAGDVSAAFGVEYRKDSVDLEADPVTRAGFTTNAVVPSFRGSIEVKEAFAEVTIPVLSRQPFFHDLTVDLAGRVGDYNIRNVGTVFSYRVGLGYAPIPDLRFRAQYGTAQRAPDLAELGSPPRDSITGVLDPCSGVTATTAGSFAANCRREPGIAAAILDNGTFQQSTTSIQTPASGNPNLREETAKTLTVGAVLQPQAVRGFSLSVDYYDIKVKNAIDPFSTEIILDQCYSAADYPNNQFCDVITRSEETGQIQQLIQAQQNLTGIRSTGIDVQAAYRSSLNKIGLPGRITFNLNWTHLINSETEFPTLTGTQVDDTVGSASDPQDRVRARLGYTLGEAYFQWRTSYIGSFVSSNARLAEIETLNIVDPKFLYFDDYYRHDFYMSLTSRFKKQRVKFYAGINNVFDKSGPILPNGGTPGSFSGYTSVYGVVGRSGYVGFEFEL